MNSVSNLPAELAPYQNDIFASSKEYIQVIPQQRMANTIWSSKLGGHPYWPKVMPYPTNNQGMELFFLAQVNFEETPVLAPFPTSGILQFFIFDQGMYGLDIDNPNIQVKFRVVYHSTPIKEETGIITDFSHLRQFDDLPIDNNANFALEFKIEKAPVPTTDYAFDEIMGDRFFEKFGDQQWDIFEVYNKIFPGTGHKMGGYAHFAQDDPRMKMEQSMMLLLQLDTDKNFTINWGDMGVANFFIRPEDLEKQDFSHVLYNWDCY